MRGLCRIKRFENDMTEHTAGEKISMQSWQEENKLP